VGLLLRGGREGGGEGKGREVTGGEGRKGREGKEEWDAGPAGRQVPGAPAPAKDGPVLQVLVQLPGPALGANTVQ